MATPKIGYAAMLEQFGPQEVVGYSVDAEQAGFTGVMAALGHGRKECLAAELDNLTHGRRSLRAARCLPAGHLVGAGWMPLNPAANFNPAVFADLIAGREIALPNLGRETLHHVHADDVAQAFVKAMANWSNACGESFHVVSPAAVSLAGYAGSVGRWFGREPRIRFLPWEEWRSLFSEKDANITWDHIARSPNCSIRKAQRLLDYQPRYTSLEAVRESLTWVVGHGMIQA
jgi:nucleoside-diphosphate-sugar epimerase